MATINPEMLKQLLQEFEEKELVTQEEINAINEQIKELEKRIIGSKERLESVAKDREKIAQMKARYAEGDWSSVLNEIKEKNGRPSAPSAQSSAPQMLADEIVAQQQAPVAPQPAFSAPVAQPAPEPAVAYGQAAQEVITFDNLPSVAQAEEQVAAAAGAQQYEVAAQAAADQAAAQAAHDQGQQAAAPQDQSLSSGLFSFSNQNQQQGQTDIPWAPPPSMTWESVGSHSTFPTQDQQYAYQQQQQQQQQNVYQQAAPGAAPVQPPQGQSPFADPNAFQQQQYAQAQTDAQAQAEAQAQAQMQAQMQAQLQAQMQAQAAQMQAQAAQMQAQQMQQPGAAPQADPNAPQQQSVFTNAYDEEFDISEALRGEEEQGQDKSGGGESDKKIKDALRGLFS